VCSINPLSHHGSVINSRQYMTVNHPQPSINSDNSWDYIFFRFHIRDFALIEASLQKLTSKETKWKNGELLLAV
jgi:hypothetical protein